MDLVEMLLWFISLYILGIAYVLMENLDVVKCVLCLMGGGGLKPGLDFGL